MKIHQLQKSKGLKDKARRRGRGNATGTGNYSGRGLKGQKSRSGHSVKPFFEGGQTSIVQRLPKARGFTRYYKLVKDVTIVNLGALDADARITDTMEINKQVLKDLGYIKSLKAFVKLLSHGDYAKHLTFVGIDASSAGAKVKMETSGTVHSVSRKAPAKVVKDPKSKVGKLKVKSLAEKKASKTLQTTTSGVKKPAKEIAKKIEAPKKVVAAVKAEKLLDVQDSKKPTKVEKPTSVAKAKPAKVTKPAAKKPAKVTKPAAKKAK